MERVLSNFNHHSFVVLMLKSKLKFWHYMLLQLVISVNLFKILLFGVFLLPSVTPSSNFSLIIFLLPFFKTVTKVSNDPNPLSFQSLQSRTIVEPKVILASTILCD